jgi:uncharacterized protein (AIM24 family)
MSATFRAESDRVLGIDVDGGVWIKPGAAIAYRGNLSFERLRTIDGRSIDEVAVREMSPLVRAAGSGRLYCAHRGAHVHVLELQGETVIVSAQDLLAFQSSLTFEMSLLGHGLGIAAGGLIVAALRGVGSFAVATHGETLRLEVTPENPLNTDPHATVAWSGGLTPTLKTDLSWRSLIGHGGQQPVQMRFEGTGFVIVQPYRDSSRLGAVENPVGAVAKLLME